MDAASTSQNQPQRWLGPSVTTYSEEWRRGLILSTATTTTTTGTGVLPAGGTRRRVENARQLLLWLRVSAPVDTSPPPKKTKATSAGPVNLPKTNNRPELCQLQFQYCHKLYAKSMGGFCAALGFSSQHITRSTSNSLPDSPRTLTTASHGREAGSRKNRTKDVITWWYHLYV